MALLEAEADAIMQFVTRRSSSRYQPAVEINIQDSAEVGDNEPDSPHVPPVHGSVGLAGQEGEAPSESSQRETEAPMETDKPGKYWNTFSNCVIYGMFSYKNIFLKLFFSLKK